MAKQNKTAERGEGFIANIDTANEEIQRLQAELDEANVVVEEAKDFKAEVGKLNTRLTDLEAKINDETETEPEKPAAVVAAPAVIVKGEEDELTKANAEVKRLQGEVDAAKKAGVKAVAAAGAETPVKVASVESAIEADKVNPVKGLTGLQRAIAANIAAQAKS